MSFASLGSGTARTSRTAGAVRMMTDVVHSDMEPHGLATAEHNHDLVRLMLTEEPQRVPRRPTHHSFALFSSSTLSLVPFSASSSPSGRSIPSAPF
jgi:hypothetical protein